MIVGTDEDKSMLPTGPVAPVEVAPEARGGIQIAILVEETTQRQNLQPAEDQESLDGVHNSAEIRKAVTQRTGRVAR